MSCGFQYRARDSRWGKVFLPCVSHPRCCLRWHCTVAWHGLAALSIHKSPLHALLLDKAQDAAPAPHRLPCAFRRQGLAKQLMGHLESVTERDEGYFVDLYVRESNANAIHMYKKVRLSVIRLAASSLMIGIKASHSL